MLSISQRGINTYSIRHYRIANIMSASNNEHRSTSSSSSVKRKRIQPGDSPGSPQPGTKVPKRASASYTYPRVTRHGKPSLTDLLAIMSISLSDLRKTRSWRRRCRGKEALQMAHAFSRSNAQLSARCTPRSDRVFARRGVRSR